MRDGHESLLEYVLKEFKIPDPADLSPKKQKGLLIVVLAFAYLILFLWKDALPQYRSYLSHGQTVCVILSLLLLMFIRGQMSTRSRYLLIIIVLSFTFLQDCGVRSIVRMISPPGFLQRYLDIMELYSIFDLTLSIILGLFVVLIAQTILLREPDSTNFLLIGRMAAYIIALFYSLIAFVLTILDDYATIYILKNISIYVQNAMLFLGILLSGISALFRRETVHTKTDGTDPTDQAPVHGEAPR